MTNDPTRRDVLRVGAVAAASTAAVGVTASLNQAAAAGEASPFDREAGATLKVSICAYSFNRLLPRGKKPGKMTMEDFLDFCARQDVVGAEPTSYYFPPEADMAYFRRYRRHAFLNGLDVTGTAIGNVFTLPAGEKRDAQIEMTKQWIDRAAELTAPTIRIFAGNQPKSATIEQSRKWFVECMEQVLPHAEKRGIFLALENHGGIVTTSDQLMACVNAIKSDWFGVNLDTGNFREPDVYAAMAKAAPHAVNVHLKVHVNSTKTGKAEADYGRIAKLLCEAGYRGYVAVEYEAKDDPHKAIPKEIAKLRRAIGAVRG